MADSWERKGWRLLGPWTSSDEAPVSGRPRGLVASRCQPSRARQLTADAAAQGCESRGERARLLQDLALAVTAFSSHLPLPLRSGTQTVLVRVASPLGNKAPGRQMRGFLSPRVREAQSVSSWGRIASATHKVVPLGHAGRWIMGNFLSWITGD